MRRFTAMILCGVISAASLVLCGCAGEGAVTTVPGTEKAGTAAETAADDPDTETETNTESSATEAEETDAPEAKELVFGFLLPYPLYSPCLFLFFLYFLLY